MDGDFGTKVVVTKDTVADPSPLGLASFALTTFVMSTHNAGWAPDYEWVGLAFFYGGLCQLLAGMWEFKRNNTFGATAFSTYGAFWMSHAFVFVLVLTGVIPEGFNEMVAYGWMLASFFIFTTYMALTALLLPLTTFTVFFLLDLTFLCLFIGHLSYQGAGVGWTAAGGYFGVITAAAAWYASCANCFNATAGKQVLFTGKPLLSFRSDD